MTYYVYKSNIVISRMCFEALYDFNFRDEREVKATDIRISTRIGSFLIFTRYLILDVEAVGSVWSKC